MRLDPDTLAKVGATLATPLIPAQKNESLAMQAAHAVEVFDAVHTELERDHKAQTIARSRDAVDKHQRD